MSFKPRPCEPNSGLRTSGLVSWRTISAAASNDSAAQVAGDGRPASASKKLVIDLSTQRSMARALFQTGMPISCSACRTPRLSVTASKLPPAMSRTSTALGKPAPSPGRMRPFGLVVSKRQAASISRRVRAPTAANALQRARVCQSFESATRAIVGSDGDASGASNSGERGIEKFQVEMAGMEALAGFERRDRHLARTKQHWIDGVEIAFEAREDFHERLTIIARARAR